jgi:ketosteroid isomerase-like protein
MKAVHLIVVSFIVFLMFSCGTKKEEQVALQNTDSLIQQWTDAWNSQDPAKVMALYADDVYLFMDTIYQGKTVLEKNFVLPSVAILKNLKCVKVAEAISGDLACQSGSYSHDWTKNDSITGSQKGYYSIVWKKQADQTWKISDFHIQ